MFDDTIPQSISINDGTTYHDPTRSKTPPGRSSLPAPSLTPSTPHKNLFSYMSPRHASASGHPTPHRTPHRHGPNLNTRSEIYSLSPVKYSSQTMLLSPRKTPRAVSKVPYKVLDAPDLADDFYLNLVDWGSQNILGVGLGQCVYMWNSTSGRVTKLCELPDDTVTSVNWIQRVCTNFVGPFSEVANNISGFPCCNRDKQGLCPDLGRTNAAPSPNHDWTHCACRRSGMERAYSDFRIS